MQIEDVHLFSDYKYTLSWNASTKAVASVVANWEKEINFYKDVNFHNLQMKNNSADIASRGYTLSNFSGKNMCWHGPEWLGKLAKMAERWIFWGSWTKRSKWSKQSENEELDREEQTIYDATNNEECTVSFPVTAPLETVKGFHIWPSF